MYEKCSHTGKFYYSHAVQFMKLHLDTRLLVGGERTNKRVFMQISINKKKNYPHQLIATFDLTISKFNGILGVNIFRFNQMAVTVQ